MNNKILFFLLFLFFCFFKGISQEPIFISGSVVDFETLEPLPYASISVKGKSIGTITNSSGDFSLKLSSGELNDSLEVSFLGFKHIKVAVNHFNKHEPIVIKLQKAVINLEEVIVPSLDTRAIILKAIENIPANYLSGYLMLQAYYREKTIRDSKPAIFNEAIIDIYKTPYRSRQKDQLRVIKAFCLSDTLQEASPLNMSNGPNSLLQGDVVKNNLLFLSKKSIKNYDFTLEGIITVEDRNTYIIKYFPNPKARKIMHHGIVYIDTESYAIIKIVEKLSEARMAASEENRISFMGYSFLIRDYEKQFAYKLHNDKWLLDYAIIKMNWDMDIKKSILTKHHFTEYSPNTITRKFESLIESVIVQVNHIPAQPFHPNEVFHNSFPLESISGYDENIWRTFNLIKRDKKTQEMIDYLKRVNSANY